MKNRLSRRDFLKMGGLSLAGLAFVPFGDFLGDFDDSNVARVAAQSVSVYSHPADDSLITGTWYRDDLVHVYEEVTAKEPKYNPVWYRVWGGFMHRGRLQRVKTILQQPVDSFPEGTRRLAEVTVPFTSPYRFTKTYGWQLMTPPLYYTSAHWVEALEEGPDGEPWYRIFDELDSNVPYFVRAEHLRMVPLEMFDPINADVPPDKKKIEVNLSAQMLYAYEYGNLVFQTTISSGIPGGGQGGDKGISTTTPDGKFEIIDKYPSKHMGYSYFNTDTKGNLFADADGYVLAGVPWTSFFTEVGVAFHGTYWHENFGTPMSHGCANMRNADANWIFRWSLPPHTATSVSNHTTRGTAVEVHY